MADINMNLAEPNIFTATLIAPDTDNSNNNFDGTSFTGVFDGNDHAISKLHIAVQCAFIDYLGLFGRISGTGAEVKNLGLEDIRISSGNDSRFIGGLCGYNYDGIISKCYVTGSITGGDYSEYIGGLCGVNNNDSNISKCYARTSVTGGNDIRYLGGLCGENDGGSIISNCYSIGSVAGGVQSYQIGGLCGSNDGPINYCYSTGLVTGGDGSGPLGGLCGSNHSGSFNACYFLDTAGPDNGYGQPLDDPNMRIQSNFVDWDFDPGDGDPSGWFMSLMNYPRLSWQQTIAFTGQPKVFITKGDSSSIQLEIYSQVDETLNWTITGHESCTWITSLSPDSGVSAGSQDLTTVTIGMDTATLSYGHYVGVLTLTADNGDNVLINILLHVTLTGSGTQASPFIIDDFCGFQDFSDEANASLYWSSGVYTRLECDLDLDPNLVGRQIYTTAVIALDLSSSSGFNGTSFSGVFNGNDHTISNLTIDTTGGHSHYLGLFGLIDGSGSKVDNLGLENVTITGGDDSYAIGGLCGSISGSSINNCYAAVSVFSGDYSKYLGGLCGYNNGIISNCYATGFIFVGDDSDELGGLCGRNYGDISNSFATGFVSVGDDSDMLGGLCGRNYGDNSNSFATGSVATGINSRFLGGLCGYLGKSFSSYDSSISNCYATGSVTGGDNSGSLGGLCGYIYKGVINSSYSTGSVTGGINSIQLGGLCGANYDSISDCYFLDSAGPDNGNGTPLSDPNMRIQSSFVNWDFVGEDTNGTEDHWQLCIDGYDYPRLAWQFSNPADFLHPGRVDNYDLMVLTNDWLSMDSRCCDIAPADNLDSIVNLFDYIEFSRYWLKEDE